jgi:hypothetical protein
VRERDGVRPDELLGPVAEQGLDRASRVEDRTARVEQPDHVRRVLHELAQAAARRFALAFGGHAIGHVAHRREQLHTRVSEDRRERHLQVTLVGLEAR